MVLKNDEPKTAKEEDSIMNEIKTNLRYSMQSLALHLFQIVLLSISTTCGLQAYAGTIFYNAIPATNSDANSGISTANQYTSAVDGGNTRGSDLVINGITLYSLSGNGETSTADNCTLTALLGTLANGGGSSESIQADGTLRNILSSMTLNNVGTDNSQQEIVLDPESLEPGTTYDLRIYICNGSGQNRQVNLAFAGDGQTPVETGFFNEDDATTSAGGFTDPNQAYYINYRYTWDGDSTPGITITQKSGSAPFCLYALTNQVVPTNQAAEPAADEEEGLSAGFINTESDQVGVASDDFYESESLNKHGRWVKLDKWGASWQPTNVPSGWCPYTVGNFQYCDDCGWTFESDEPWAWATYHYGRWTKVHSGCGWAWVPGKVWAGSWVSWRQGQDNSCDCVGWAPLPPEAGCDLEVGVSTWADQQYDIGPDYYNFINIRDFGASSYFGGGYIYNRSQNINIINQTVNITNIVYNNNVTYSGGLNYNTLNREILSRGGRGIATVNMNQVRDVGRFQNGEFAYRRGDQRGNMSPRIRTNTAAHTPKFAETLGSDKIDKGWGSVKDPKIRNDLRNRIAKQNNGINPKTTRATLPPGVAQDVLKKHHGPKQGGPQTADGNARPGQFKQHPGGPRQGGPQTADGNARPGQFKQHPGGPRQGGPQTADGNARPGQFKQHPGGPKQGGPQTADGNARPGQFKQHPGGPRQGGPQTADGNARPGQFKQHPGGPRQGGPQTTDGNAGPGQFKQHPGGPKQGGPQIADGNAGPGQFKQHPGGPKQFPQGNDARGGGLGGNDVANKTPKQNKQFPQGNDARGGGLGGNDVVNKTPKQNKQFPQGNDARGGGLGGNDVVNKTPKQNKQFPQGNDARGGGLGGNDVANKTQKQNKQSASQGFSPLAQNTGGAGPKPNPPTPQRPGAGNGAPRPQAGVGQGHPNQQQQNGGNKKKRPNVN
jgi:hypothetical protein